MPGIAKNDNSDTNKAANNPTMQPPNSPQMKLKPMHLSWLGVVLLALHCFLQLPSDCRDGCSWC